MSKLATPTGRRSGAESSTDRSVELGRDLKAGKQRRKIQNRKNQRAHRLRLRENDADGHPRRSRPYQVGLWRLDEPEECPYELTSSTAMSAPATSETSHSHFVTAVASTKTSYPLRDPELWFPLSVDHLLHLIHFNVLRGLIANKRTLGLCGARDDSFHLSPTSCPLVKSGTPCWSDPTMRPFGRDTPGALVPTPLQATRTHPLWINVLPFPRVRDNLIERGARFDHWEFLRDLLGDLLSADPPRRPGESFFRSSDALLPARQEKVEEEGADELTAGRRGLIVWGEPHRMENWEATPGFLAKWAWAVDGCDELVESSNRWRMVRGEEPVSLAAS